MVIFPFKTCFYLLYTLNLFSVLQCWEPTSRSSPCWASALMLNYIHSPFNTFSKWRTPKCSLPATFPCNPGLHFQALPPAPNVNSERISDLTCPKQLNSTLPHCFCRPPSQTRPAAAPCTYLKLISKHCQFCL